jgi:hypothetical protein
LFSTFGKGWLREGSFERLENLSNCQRAPMKSSYDRIFSEWWQLFVTLYVGKWGWSAISLSVRWWWKLNIGEETRSVEVVPHISTLSEFVRGSDLEDETNPSLSNKRPSSLK